MKHSVIGVGLLGVGVVGAAVARTLLEQGPAMERRVGRPLRLLRALVRDATRPRDVALPPGVLTTSAGDVLDDPAVDIVVELLGGEEPARAYQQAALARGKHVVTANKEVIAKHGQHLFAEAALYNRALLFEAAVGGGIPVIGPLSRDLLANDVTEVRAIINGTTNYILTRMAREGADFDAVLKDAQRLGYAEPDPTNDVEGYDAAYKAAILATLAFHTPVRVEDVYVEGITRLAARDFEYAADLGYAIKLLAICHREGDEVEVRVHPAFVPADTLLGKVDGPFNAIQVVGSLAGEVTFHGRGAGAKPTTSAVLGDVIELARRVADGAAAPPPPRLNGDIRVRPMSEVRTGYYFRVTVPDRPGVLARIAQVLGDNNVSIASVVQKDTPVADNLAELVITTHQAREAAVQKALGEMAKLPVVERVNTFVRVERERE